ncbi:protein ALP1-like [Pseudomyrmex gracilis]|uniref:protein ALP1-like n=1 Tax=Pseudomyrmex gracilis TaxID=219809 RepID=UPI0009951945|nr:protein ALP1-like [Pseudomyrmex gracilis]
MYSKALCIVICGLCKKLKKNKNAFYQQKLRRKIEKLYILYTISKKEENKKKERRYWVRTIFVAERRLLQGASNNLVKEMQEQDVEKYVDYFRLPPQLFEELLKLVGPVITKEQVVRDPILPETRLQITLRFLASGDSMKLLSYAFRIGHNTVSKIVSETCEAIWNCLKDTVFLTDNEESWLSVANDFEELWNFPNCIGAIDGKHVNIQAPANSGSTYYNYKKQHSINLLGISDATYCFTVVDIGAEGRQSDGGVFRNSIIGKRFESNSFKLPNPRQIEIGGPALPYVLIADEAFPLTTYMMTPYTRGRKLNIGKKVFNYRLSRARRVVESAFGILVTRWRIYRKPIIATVTNVQQFVKATLILHNFIIKNEKKMTKKNTYIHRTLQDKQNISGVTILPVYRGRSNNIAMSVREAYSTYFQDSGALSYQWEKAIQNDF